METACQFNEEFTAYPFAYRTHAHTHGEYRCLEICNFYPYETHALTHSE